MYNWFRKFKTSRSQQRNVQRYLRVTIGILASLYALFPVIFIISSSLDPTNSLASAEIVPRIVSFVNYRRLLNNPIYPFQHWLFNSFKVSSISAVLAVLLTGMSAYAFSRFRFRGRRPLLLTVLLVQVFPNTLAMVALFLLVQQIGNYIPSLGLNTHGGLILVYLGGVLGFNTWLMKGFFDSIPRELDESAMIDGASHWQAFQYVILPLARPILAVVGILTFIGTYGDFVVARVLLQSTENYTLAVGLYTLVATQYTQQWGVFAAGALIGAIPIVIVFLFLQDQLVSGLTSGAVKG
jgi:ABC-type maltose transport system permease subunit